MHTLGWRMQVKYGDQDEVDRHENRGNDRGEIVGEEYYAKRWRVRREIRKKWTDDLTRSQHLRIKSSRDIRVVTGQVFSISLEVEDYIQNWQHSGGHRTSDRLILRRRIISSVRSYYSSVSQWYCIRSRLNQDNRNTTHMMKRTKRRHTFHRSSVETARKLRILRSSIII